MKTIFTSAFLSERQYFMGQQSGTIPYGTLDYAITVYNQGQTWLNNTPNPDVYLGTDYPQFAQQESIATGLINNVVGYDQTLGGGGTLTSDQNNEASQFVNAATYLWALIQAHPAPAATTPAGPAKILTSPAPGAAPSTAAQAITAAGAAGSAIIKANTPATPVKPAVPAKPAAAPDMTTPLLIGGGITVAVILALVVSK